MDDADQKYSILKLIGKGSYGEVFLVKQMGEKKMFVMKSIRLSGGSSRDCVAAVQEATLLSRLKHPNIVAYKESFQDGGDTLHIVMEYCKGGDLCSRLKSYRGQLLSETQVVEWFVQIALALQYLHDKNILHRDLKTQNIFLTKNDIIKVGDLGIARVLDGSCDLAHTIIGTPYYMSPELFASKPYNHKSDVWALGCCVHEMATLKHAFSAKNINALMYKIIQGQIPPLPSCFSWELNKLVCTMLSQDPSKRPTVQQILHMEYVRSHIRRFLDKAIEKRRARKDVGPSDSSGAARETRAIGSSTSNTSSDEHGLELPQADMRRRHSTNSVKQLGVVTSNSSGVDSPGSERATKRAQGSKRPPRPLPPDPTPSSDVAEDSPKMGLSSAREKRRRSKLQEQGGGRQRIILRSRSNDQLPQRQDQPDYATPPTALMGRDSVSNTSVGGKAVNEEGEGESGKEEDEVMTLLDGTLHLPEPTDQYKEEWTPKEAFAADYDSHTPLMATIGRLKERTAVLRRECVAGLGEVMVEDALKLLDAVDGDSLEIEMRALLGHRCDLFLAKLQQLNLWKT